MSSLGLLLAAGAGRRMGRPKALVEDAAGEAWVRSSVRVLRDGGCAEVVVVLGAEAAVVRPMLGDLSVEVVTAADWSEGMGASLRTGLEALASREEDAAVVHLVDLPDVGPAVVARFVAEATVESLRRATYDGRPGHPVLVGRDHWRPMAASLSGDVGARAYLRDHQAAAVECGDLASGRDVDRPR